MSMYVYVYLYICIFTYLSASIHSDLIQGEMVDIKQKENKNL